MEPVQAAVAQDRVDVGAAVDVDHDAPLLRRQREPALVVHVVAVGKVRDALQRAELLEDERPLVDAAAALHDDRLDAHLDEDVLLGGTVVGAELELAVGPAEEVEGGVLDLLTHRLLEGAAVEASLLEEDAAQPGALRRLLLRGERLLELARG